jgi:hypothetical protein
MALRHQHFQIVSKERDKARYLLKRSHQNAQALINFCNYDKDGMKFKRFMDAHDLDCLVFNNGLCIFDDEEGFEQFVYTCSEKRIVTVLGYTNKNWMMIPIVPNMKKD